MPLIFKFKLFAISRLDQDGDGIPFRRFEWRWIYESFSSTNLYPTTLSDAIRYADDTDRDGIPNF
jgi:hypothetical protein